jgi:hypothetical protein
MGTTGNDRLLSEGIDAAMAAVGLNDFGFWVSGIGYQVEQIIVAMLALLGRFGAESNFHRTNRPGSSVEIVSRS